MAQPLQKDINILLAELGHPSEVIIQATRGLWDAILQVHLSLVKILSYMDDIKPNYKVKSIMAMA